MTAKISIEESTIEIAALISKQIPELVNPHPVSEYQARMYGRKSLILVAYVDNIAAGFKVGYDKLADGSFYSWMGGVLPGYRKHRVATALAQKQESWARENGYTSIMFKTRNCHTSMLIFALKNGFSIVGFEPKGSADQHRVILKKDLIQHR